MNHGLVGRMDEMTDISAGLPPAITGGLRGMNGQFVQTTVLATQPNVPGIIPYTGYQIPGNQVQQVQQELVPQPFPLSLEQMMALIDNADFSEIKTPGPSPPGQSFDNLLDTVPLDVDNIDEPMNVASLTMREILAEDPTLGEERFHSREPLNPGPNPGELTSRDGVSCAMDVDPPDANPAPAIASAGGTPGATPGGTAAATPGATPGGAMTNGEGHLAALPHITQEDTSRNGRGVVTSGGDDPYELPEFHSFHLTVNFMSAPMIETKIQNPYGCLLYYNPPHTQVIHPDARCERLPISKKDDYKYVSEKQQKYTEKVLKSLDKGVYIYSKGGDLYARRLCSTKIFWSSTQRTEDKAIELVRGDETLIFSYSTFEEQLRNLVQTCRRLEIKRQNVFFSFAQQWDRGTSQLHSKLVTAVIEPLRTKEMVMTMNPEARQMGCVSLTSSLFCFSNEPSSGTT